MTQNNESTLIYVYVVHHATETDGEGNPLAVYVGKGGGRREKWFNQRNAQITALIRGGQTRKAVRVAEGLTEAEAHAVEAELIARHGRADLGLGPLLNLTDGGAGVPGSIQTAASRAKRSAALKGKPKSPAHVARNAAARKGKTHSPETRAKISAALRGNKNGLGWTPPAETRAKMSAAQRNRQPASAETRAKLSAALAGRTFSAETRARMSAARRGKIYAKSAMNIVERII
jgi:hypothetical protein